MAIDVASLGASLPNMRHSGLRQSSSYKAGLKKPLSAFVPIASTSQLSSSARHVLTLRSKDASRTYHSLVLYRFVSPPPEVRTGEERHEDGEIDGAEGTRETPDEADRGRWYCMEATCPHAGGPMENASLEEVEIEEGMDDIVAVCPWHEYDFSLSTGESSTGMRTCVYEVRQVDGMVWVETPSLGGRELEGGSSGNDVTQEDGDGVGGTRGMGSDWEVVEVRPVSEAFPTLPKSKPAAHSAENFETSSAPSVLTSSNDVPRPTPIPDDALPRTLTSFASLILRTPSPAAKVALTRQAVSAFRSGRITRVRGLLEKEEERPPDVPERDESEVKVEPGKMGRRGKGGSEKSRIALLHSLANIEQWAIDLSWDIIARFAHVRVGGKEWGGEGQGRPLPVQFFADFAKVAEDEAKHFSLLSKRLEEMGSHFGALPVHHGLWESARTTAHSLLSRLCIIHLVHEARGLDVNPVTIKKFEAAGDAESVRILNIIHNDEVTHVATGHRWLLYLCSSAVPPLDPVKVFRDEVRTHFSGALKGPFNAADRRKAGLEKEWYEGLKGEKGWRDAGVGGQVVGGG